MNRLMIALIKKDLTLQKTSIQAYLISPLLFIILFAAMDNLHALSFLLAFQLIFVYTLIAFNREEKNNTYRHLLTMPISRDQLVTGRYVSVALISLIVVPVIMIIQFVLRIGITGLQLDINTAAMNWTTAVYGSATILFIMSFYLPIAFKLGAAKSTVYVRLLMVIVIAGAFAIQLILDFLETVLGEKAYLELAGWFTSLESWIPAAGALILGLCLMAVSSKVACSIFKKRDLFT